jgi:hypothetical protein
MLNFNLHSNLILLFHFDKTINFSTGDRGLKASPKFKYLKDVEYQPNDMFVSRFYPIRFGERKINYVFYAENTSSSIGNFDFELVLVDFLNNVDVYKLKRSISLNLNEIKEVVGFYFFYMTPLPDKMDTPAYHYLFRFSSLNLTTIKVSGVIAIERI